jgi:protein SCO1
MRAALASALVTLASLALVWPHDALDPGPHVSALPKIAPAPEFSLTSQDGTQVNLGDLRGKVVAVTFIYTTCTSTCPVLTPTLSFVQDRLGRDFGERIVFVSITIDPERDTHTC